MAQQRKSSDRLVMTLAGIAGLLLSLCVLLAAKIYNPSTYERMLRISVVEEPLPFFEVESVSGKRISSQQFKGNSFLLFFGDPDCPACQSSYPVLRQVQNTLPIVFVSRGDRKRVMKLLEKEQFTFPVVFDSLQNLNLKAGLSGVPSALLVNREGMIIRQTTGDGITPSLIEYAATYVQEEK